MRDRLKETCEREFECGVERMVKRVFEARGGLPDELYEIPWIGGTYRPRAPRTSHADLMRNVCRALCAQKWFEHTAPSRPQPLSTPWHCDRRVGIAPRTRPSTNSWHTNCAASRRLAGRSGSADRAGRGQPTSRTKIHPSTMVAATRLRRNRRRQTSEIEGWNGMRPSPIWMLGR